MGQCRVMFGYEPLRHVGTLRVPDMSRDKEDGGADNSGTGRLCHLSLPLAKEELKRRVVSRRDPLCVCRHGGGRQEASGVAVHSRRELRLGQRKPLRR